MRKEPTISRILALASLVGALVVAGCDPRQDEPRIESEPPVVGQAPASAPAEGVDSMLVSDPAAEQLSLDEQQRELAEREAEVRAREAEVARRESEQARGERVARRPQASPVSPTPAPSPERPAVESQGNEPVRPVEEARVEEPAPVRKLIEVVVPAGTLVDVEFEDSLSSATSVLGERFQSRVVADVSVDGERVIPAGSMVFGSVTEVVPQKKIGGQARIALSFDRLELPSGESVAMQASFAEAGQKQTRKDAATIGGSAAGGAILGRVIDRKNKDKGSVIGAIVGAAVGTAVAANNAGDDVEIPVGTVLALRLDNRVILTVER